MIRVLSDLHLGHQASAIECVSQLDPLLEGVETLILNGDISEQLAPEFRDRGQSLREEWLARLASGAIAVVELRGNHDPHIKGAPYREYLQGEVLIHHGDGVLPRVSPWSREVWRHRHLIQDFIDQHWRDDFTRQQRFDFARDLELAIPQIKHPRANNGLLRLLQLFAWPPHRPLLVLGTWAQAGRNLANWAYRYSPQARLMICGHFHRRIAYRAADGRQILVNGSFANPCAPSFVDLDLETGRASQGLIELREGRFHPASKAIMSLRRCDQGSWVQAS